MKGLTVLSLLAMVFMGLLGAFIILTLPKFFTDFLFSILHYTAESVARDLSSLVTSSSAFTGEVYIFYATPFTYEVDIKDRIYKVNMLTQAGPLDLRATIKFGKSKAGVDNVETKFSSGVFIIQKSKDSLDFVVKGK